MSHKNSTNKLIHWICVPLIYFSIIGFLTAIPTGLLTNIFAKNSFLSNWAVIFLILSTAYYLSLSIPLSIGLFLFSVLCVIECWIIQNMGLSIGWISLSIFAIAWISQFYGHHIEGKKPSFLKDLQFLLIGPAWLMHFIYKKTGINY